LRSERSLDESVDGGSGFEMLGDVDAVPSTLTGVDSLDRVLVVLIGAGTIRGRESERIEPDGVAWRSAIKEAPVGPGRAGLQIDHEELSCFVSPALDRAFVIDSTEIIVVTKNVLDLCIAQRAFARHTIQIMQARYIESQRPRSFIRLMKFDRMERL